MSAASAIRRRWPLIASLALVGAAVLTAIVAGPAWLEHAQHPLLYRGEIQAAASRHRVDPYLIAAVINAESGFDPRTVSKRGAVGLMQLMPETAEALGESERTAVPTNREALMDPAVNIELGTLYLRQLLSRYDSEELALAAYNAGATHVDDWIADAGEDDDVMDVIRYPQTRAFVSRVMRERKDYADLYPGEFEAVDGSEVEARR